MCVWCMYIYIVHVRIVDVLNSKRWCSIVKLSCKITNYQQVPGCCAIRESIKWIKQLTCQRHKWSSSHQTTAAEFSQQSSELPTRIMHASSIGIHFCCAYPDTDTRMILYDHLCLCDMIISTWFRLHMWCILSQTIPQKETFQLSTLKKWNAEEKTAGGQGLSFSCASLQINTITWVIWLLQDALLERPNAI